MKYNVVIEGIGQSIYFSDLTTEQKSKIQDYSNDQQISQNEVIFNDLNDVLNLDWTEICNHQSITGIIPELSTIKVYDEFDKIIFDRKISELPNSVDYVEFEYDLEFDNDEVLFCLHKEKGTYMDDLVDFEEKFNPKNLTMSYEILEMSDGTKYTVCTGFEYNDNISVLFPLDTKYYSFETNFF